MKKIKYDFKIEFYISVEKFTVYPETEKEYYLKLATLERSGIYYNATFKIK